MALADALKYLEIQSGDPVFGYISRADIQDLVTTIYADRLPGDEGQPGPRGDPGAPGITGRPGIQGIQGIIGITGGVGPAGPSGIDTVTAVSGGVFGTAPVATYNPATKALQLSIPQGPPTPAGVAQVIKSVVTLGSAQPAAVTGDLIIVAGEPPVWAPVSISGDILARTATSTWVNVGPLTLAKISTNAGQVLTLDTQGQIYHKDSDHGSMFTQAEAAELSQDLIDLVDDRLPLVGGTVTGPIVAPETTWQHPVGTLTTREFVADNFIRTSAANIEGDLTVLGDSAFYSMSVVSPVFNLLVAPATDEMGALQLSQARDIFATVDHMHADHAMLSQVVRRDQATTLTSELSLGSGGALLSSGMGLSDGLRIAPALPGSPYRPDPEHSFYYDTQTKRFVVTAPVSGESVLEVRTPIRQETLPSLPLHTANKQYVDGIQSQAVSQSAVYTDTAIANLRDELVALINAQP